MDVPRTAPAVVWFRNDLRLHDNPALSAACARGGPVIGLYILDEETQGVRPPGGAARWWLHHSLAALARDLERLRIPLLLRRGAARTVLEDVAGATGAGLVAWNRRYDPGGIACDSAIKAALRNAGTAAKSFNANLLTEPMHVQTGRGAPYRVFTPYWRAARAAIPDEPPLPAPAGPMPQWTGDATSDALDAWGLLPTRPDWAAGLRDSWTPGEAGACAALQGFLDGPLSGYGTHRDAPCVEGTSLLSPHLSFGEISPRTIWTSVHKRIAGQASLRRDGDKFLSELGWREFSYHLLFHFPDIVTENFNRKFDDFRWRDDERDLKLWQRGETGYPIVDAGMRQLWATGYMHNRVRMIVASFLTKHLRIHWREGEAWFWDTLVDADIASNVANWQWVAGTGADAAPYFRVFNPMLQGAKFDPKGAYVRRWVPELGGLPDRFVHAPWEAPTTVHEGAKLILGGSYPFPMVDHAEAREGALDAFQKLKKG